MVRKKREDLEARRRRLTIAIEAVEKAIERSYFIVEAQALKRQLDQLQNELHEVETGLDTENPFY